MIKLKEILNEGLDLKKLETAIKDFQKKIKKQGRVTNARDEEHLKQLIKVYKQMGGRKIKEEKLNEDKSLAYFQHIGYDIFDSIQKLDKEMKKHSVAKKSGKIKQIIKGLYKLESDLGEAINDLDVPQSNRGYDKKRFKKR